MNKTRRCVIRKLYDQLAEAADQLAECRDDEQAAFDNLPESLQQSDRGEAMESAAYELDDAWEQLQLAMEAIERAIE